MTGKDEPPEPKKKKRAPRMPRRSRPTRKQTRSMIQVDCPTCRNGSNKASCPLCGGEGKVWVTR